MLRIGRGLIRPTAALFVLLGVILAVARPSFAVDGVTDDTITIGAFGPLTGHGAFIGLAGRDGLNLAVKQINDAGGVNGRKIKLIVEDDAFSPTKALAAVRKLIGQDHAFMIISIAGSNSTVGAIDYVRDHDVVMYVSIASAPQVTHPFSRYLFRGATNEVARYGEVNTEFVTQVLQGKRIAILSGRDEYAKNEADQNTRLLKDWWNIEPLGRFEFNIGDKDFSPQLLQIKSLDPDVIMLSANPAEGAIILRQARELGLNQSFFGGSSLVNNTVPQAAGRAAEGLTGLYNLPYIIGSTNPAMAEWEAAWKAEYPDLPPGRPNHYDVMAYSDMYVIAEAMRKAGRDLTTDSLIEALESIKDYRVSPVATPRTFTHWHHIGNLSLQPMVILNGHWIPLMWQPSHESDILRSMQEEQKKN